MSTLTARQAGQLLSALLVSMLVAFRSAGQAPLCDCINAWQSQVIIPNGCPLKDSTGAYDRGAKSYILYAGDDAGAQSALEQMLTTIRTCDIINKGYEVHSDYDQVQMNNVYTFIPASVAKTEDGKQPFMPLKMELSLKSRASSSAVLLKITGPAPIPGGEAGFANATQNLLKEWSDAIARNAPFNAPGKGWAALYPGARYTGANAATGRYGSGIVYNYEWQGEHNVGEGLQQSMVQALKKIPAIAANGSWHTEIVPGKSSISGCRLLPPNPPLRIETDVESTDQAGIVRLSIIVPGGKISGQ